MSEQGVKMKISRQTQLQLTLPDACYNLHSPGFVYIFVSLCWHLGKYVYTQKLVQIYIYSFRTIRETFIMQNNQDSHVLGIEF